MKLRWPPILRAFLSGLLWLCLAGACMGEGANAAEKNAGRALAEPSLVGVAGERAQREGIAQRFDELKRAAADTQNFNKLTSVTDSLRALSAQAADVQGGMDKKIQLLQMQLGFMDSTASAQDARGDEAAEEKALGRQKTSLDEERAKVTVLMGDMQSMTEQLIKLRREKMRGQLSLRSYSILSYNYWNKLIDYSDEDKGKYARFYQDVRHALNLSFSPPLRNASIAFSVFALLIATVGFHLLNKLTTWVAEHKLPNGRLRRSFFTIACTFTTTLTLGVATSLLLYTLTRHGQASADLLQFTHRIFNLCIFCALLFGIGRAYLSNKYPSWRLPHLSEPIAKALQPFAAILAALLLLTGGLEILNEQINVRLSLGALISGISALLTAVWIFWTMTRINHVRRRLRTRQSCAGVQSLWIALLQKLSLLIAIVIGIALLTGYVSLARFIAYEFVWIGMVFLCAYLLIRLTEDICEAVFAPEGNWGRNLKEALGADDSRLKQAQTLLRALGRIAIVVMAIITVIKGSFGDVSPSGLLQKAVEIFGADNLGKFSISPENWINAALFLCIAVYVLRKTSQWLEKDYLPHTRMDAGLRASIIALFVNMGYAVIFLLTLSTLGVQWNKLAWIVSALSVGIGFGLQEIVKNFISGVILLTERPVKVGDLINISGIEGDIRKINVRATEIQLSDRSIAIIPNSQLISQNLRNITMDGANGVATLSFNFALDIDPEQVSALLLGAYRENTLVMQVPAPSVMFSQLSPDGIALSVTGYVASPRIVSRVKSDLLLEILKRLRAHNVSLSIPKTMMVVEKQKTPLDNGAT